MLTPLLDIMFLVLVFFMVHNSPAQRSLEVEVEPPYMPSAPIAENETLPKSQPSQGPQPTLGPQPSRGLLLLVNIGADMSYSIGLRTRRGLRNLQNGEIAEQWSGPEARSGRGADALAGLKRQLAGLRTTLEAQGRFARIEKIRLRADYRLNYGQIIAICELLYLWPKPVLLPLELDVSQSVQPANHSDSFAPEQSDDAP